MFVAIPTAIPAAPLTSRFGKRDVDIAQHLGCEWAEPRFRVPHRGGRIVVDRAEVPLPVDQRVAQGEVLRHPDQRVVDRRVAVRVVLTHHLADDERALPVGPVRLEAEVVHRVEDAPVDRLQPVPDIGQRPSDDHAHRVIEVGGAHLLLELAGLERLGHVDQAVVGLSHAQSPPSRCAGLRGPRA
jgi:hypothetical protein